MTEEQLDQLHKEVKAGEQASMAWMAYIKKYTEDMQKEIFQRFLDAPMNDCFMLKYEQMALDQLVSGILLTIETGRIAEKQLEDK